MQRGAERSLREATATGGGSVDGRTLRSIRTRAAVVDALLALIEEGDIRPTAPRIAERAGVSLRSVFQHFSDLEALHAAVARRKLEEVAALQRPVDPSLPLAERVDAFVDQRTRILEMLTPVRRAALAQVPMSIEGQAGEATLMDIGRRTVASAFAPELEATADETEREVLLESLNMVCSWQAWESLRRYQQLDADRARAVVAGTLRCLLGLR